MNGYFNISTSNQYIVGTVSWYEYNIDKVNNKSWVHAELRLSRTNNYTTYSTTGGYNLNIDGQPFYGQATADKKITLNSNTLMVSGDAEIKHNSNGSKSITITIDGNTSNLTITSQSGLAVLTTIPRESNLTFGNGIIGQALNLNINRNSDTFTHKITYSFGTLSGDVASNVGDFCSWIIPTSFYTQLLGKYGTGTLNLETYNGSTKIGETKSYLLTVWCNESECIPELNGTIKDVNAKTIALTGSTDKNVILVDGQSIAEINLTYSAKNNATISKIYINNVAQIVGTKYQLIPQADTHIIRVEDSRGYSKEIIFQSADSNLERYFKRIKYIPVTIKAITKRPTQIGSNIEVSLDGNYFNQSFSENVRNALTLSWKVREKGAEKWTDGITKLEPTIENNIYKIINLNLENPISLDNEWDYKKNYEFVFIANDLLMSKEHNEIRPKGKFNFAIFPNAILSNNRKKILDIDLIYPVGSYYETSDETFDPNKFWGGEWVLDSAGRVLVAQDTKQQEFDKIGKIGGHKELQTHTHSMDYSGTHTHISNVKFSGGNGTDYGINWSQGPWQGPYENALGAMNTTEAGNHVHNIHNSGNGNGGNMPPFLVVIRWHRIK